MATVFTSSELLRENQHRGETTPQLRLGLICFIDILFFSFQPMHWRQYKVNIQENEQTNEVWATFQAHDLSLLRGAPCAAVPLIWSPLRCCDTAPRFFTTAPRCSVLLQLCSVMLHHRSIVFRHCSEHAPKFSGDPCFTTCHSQGSSTNF